MSVSIEKSPIARRIAGLKEFDHAKKTAASVLAGTSVSDYDREAIALVLAEHKDNPDRQTAVKADGEVVANTDGTPAGPPTADEAKAKVGRVWEETIGGVSKDEIKAKMEAGEITFDQALELSNHSSGLSLFCSAKSGWICLPGRGQFPTNIHPEKLRAICVNAAAVLAVLDRHAAETAKALKAAK